MSAAILAAECEHELNGLRLALSRISEAQGKGLVNSDDLQLTVEGLTLAAHVAFEKFIRRLFLECVSGVSGLDNLVSRIKPAAPEVIDGIVTGDTRFLDWLPIKETQERAYRYVSNGQPFSRLEFRSSILVALSELQVVRNRIAHSGEEAQAKYEKVISQGDQSFSRPARWLLHRKPASPNSNFDRIIHSSTRAARVLGSRSPDIDSLLGAPEAAQAGRLSPSGRYQCQNCSAQLRLPERSKLPNCSCQMSSHWVLTHLYVR